MIDIISIVKIVDGYPPTIPDSVEKINEVINVVNSLEEKINQHLRGDMKFTKITEGVVAEYKGEYWGFQHGAAHYTCNDFGGLDNAKIVNPELCTKPTDFTYSPVDGVRHSDYDKLSKAKLVNVKKTITIEII